MSANERPDRRALKQALVPWLPLLGAALAAPAAVVTMHLPPSLAMAMFISIALVGATTSFMIDDDWQKPSRPLGVQPPIEIGSQPHQRSSAHNR